MPDKTKWIKSQEDDVYFSRKPNKSKTHIKAKITPFKYKFIALVSFNELPDDVKNKVIK